MCKVMESDRGRSVESRSISRGQSVEDDQSRLINRGRSVEVDQSKSTSRGRSVEVDQSRTISRRRSVEVDQSRSISRERSVEDDQSRTTLSCDAYVMAGATKNMRNLINVDRRALHTGGRYSSTILISLYQFEVDTARNI